jgi:hypothetical protein
LGEEPGLHLFCDLHFLGGAAFGFQLLRDGAALRFDFPAHLVGAHKRESVPVHIFEAGEHSAPRRNLRRMTKTNPALTPLLVYGVDIFGDKNKLLCLADQAIFFGARLRSDKRKEPGAIRRRHRYPAAAAFKAVISDQIEPKLIQVKLQASILIANEDSRAEDAQVGRLAIQAHSCPLPPRR